MRQVPSFSRFKPVTSVLRRSSAPPSTSPSIRARVSAPKSTSVPASALVAATGSSRSRPTMSRGAQSWMTFGSSEYSMSENSG